MIDERVSNKDENLQIDMIAEGGTTDNKQRVEEQPDEDMEGYTTNGVAYPGKDC